MVRGLRARSAERHSQRVLEVGGRIGWVINAVQHVVIGLLAIQIAWGGGGQADQGGALGAVAAQPFGRTLLWLFVIGFAALSLVHLARMVGVRGREVGKDRAQAGFLAVYYAALTLFALQYARGSGGGGGGQDVTAQAFAWTGGQFVVGVVGLVIAGIGADHCWKGATSGFRHELDFRDLAGSSGTGVERVAQFGYILKGLALVLIGALVVIAAVQTDPNGAVGLDAALKELASQPFGPYLLSLVGLGFIAFGGYLAVRARRGKV